MDGRVIIPVTEWMQERYGVDVVDMVTEPGINRILALNTDEQIIGNIERRIAISIRHGSKVIAVVAHHDCAGNQVDRDMQIKQLERAVEAVSSFGFPADVIALWVNDSWEVEEIDLVEADLV